MLRIDAKEMHYRLLNERIREAVRDGVQSLEISNTNGHRYIGAGLEGPIKITVHGVPGNDLGVFMDGPGITVYGNGQDGCGNTMNNGMIVIHGSAGDVLGYAMRGGEIYIRGDVGFRVGIHMKEFLDQVPAIVIGGKAGDFLGEYMAGGVIVVLGLDCRPGEPVAGKYLGTGMHGGVMYIRGVVDEVGLGKEVQVLPLDEGDEPALVPLLKSFGEHFGIGYDDIRREPFVKMLPVSRCPYGRLYTA